MDPPNPSSQAACAKPSPMETIYSGITQNSFTLVQQGLDIFASSRKGLTSRVLDRTLNLAIKRAKPGIVRYLLDETDCSVAGLSWFHVGFAATTKGNGAGEWGFECEVEDVIAVLEVLVEKGLDVNKAYINT